MKRERSPVHREFLGTQENRDAKNVLATFGKRLSSQGIIEALGSMKKDNEWFADKIVSFLTSGEVSDRTKMQAMKLVTELLKLAEGQKLTVSVLGEMSDGELDVVQRALVKRLSQETGKNLVGMDLGFPGRS